MPNPYPQNIEDEVSGAQVPNPLWLAWEQGLSQGLLVGWVWLGEYNALLNELLNYKAQKQKDRRAWENEQAYDLSHGDFGQ